MTTDKKDVVMNSTAFTKLLNSIANVEGALVVTSDGFVVAAKCSPNVEERRLAAMTSSSIALGSQLADGLGQGRCEHLILENGKGLFVCRNIDEGNILAVFAGPDTKIGNLVSACRQCADELKPLFDERLAG
jgi:predicted regulator of Ras-like GTPase activity (Roadblock/LC7/MglB family)